MAGKDDWVEDVRRWCFESSRPAEASLDDADTGDASAHGTADRADAIAAVRPWFPSLGDAIDPRDRNLLARQTGDAA